jgi:hypothetical protein
MLPHGGVPERAQEDAAATLAPTIGADDATIDWERSPEEIVRWVRALAPRPGAATALRGAHVKVLAAAIDHQRRATAAGHRRGGGRARRAGARGRGRGALVEVAPAGASGWTARRGRAASGSPRANVWDERADRAVGRARADRPRDRRRRVLEPAAAALLRARDSMRATAPSRRSSRSARFAPVLLLDAAIERRRGPSARHGDAAEARHALRLGAYQLSAGVGTPGAAVSATVDLVPGRARGFVNAVLRRWRPRRRAPRPGRHGAIAARTGMRRGRSRSSNGSSVTRPRWPPTALASRAPLSIRVVGGRDAVRRRRDIEAVARPGDASGTVRPRAA